MRRTRNLRKTAMAPQPSGPAEPVGLGGWLAFVLYAVGMIGCLGTITALIEKAAP